MCFGHTKYTDKFITVPQTRQEKIMSEQAKTYDLERIQDSEYNNQLEMVEAYKDTGDWMKTADAERIIQQAREEATKAERERCLLEFLDLHRFESAPCYICGYNGPGYFQPDTHPCAKHYHSAVSAKIKERREG